MKIATMLLIACLALPMASGAQSRVKDFNEFYEKYSDKRGVNSKKFGRTMLKVMVLAGGKEASDKLPKGLNQLKTLTVEADSKVDAATRAAMERDFMEFASAAPYSIVVEKSEKGAFFKAYARPGSTKDKVRDIIFFSKSDKGAGYILMAGEFSRDEEFFREMTKK